MTERTRNTQRRTQSLFEDADKICKQVDEESSAIECEEYKQHYA